LRLKPRKTSLRSQTFAKVDLNSGLSDKNYPVVKTYQTAPERDQLRTPLNVNYSNSNLNNEYLLKANKNNENKN
jgi:hypothetical protein